MNFYFINVLKFLIEFFLFTFQIKLINLIIIIRKFNYNYPKNYICHIYVQINIVTIDI